MNPRPFLLRFALLAIVALHVPSAFAATAPTLGTPLTLGTSFPLSFSPSPSFSTKSLITNIYFDVDASAKQLVVSIAGSGGDIDLFLRYGSPFPDTSQCSSSASAPCVSYEMYQRYAQYHSVSSSSNESIVVTNASTIPLAAGRWYLTVVNASSSSATGTLTATISTSVTSAAITLDFGNASSDCDITPWTDSTPATPVGGNTGTTLGAQRQNALQYAVQQLASQINSPVPITVHACWDHEGGTSTRAPLAHATSTTVAFTDTSFPMPWLAKRYTWYTNTQVARMGGTTNCGALGGSCSGVNNDLIEITFNSDIGSSSVLGGEPFYFGYTPDSTSSSADFIAIAMHEITHGLGFSGMANTDPTAGPLGARAGLATAADGSVSLAYDGYTEGPWDDIYGDNVANVASNGQSYTPFYGYETNDQPNNAVRAASLVSGNTVTSTSLGNLYAPTLLRWSDPLAVNSTVNQATGSPPNDFPSLFAPCDLTATTTCSTEPGSTLSHTVQQGDLMNAFYNVNQTRTLGLAGPMLAAMGWSTAQATAPVYAQPFTGIWYDRAHSGHGLDFRYVGHDVNGYDAYFVVFYTYDASGAVETFQAQGSIVDGVFIPAMLGADGSTLVRMHYDAASKQSTATTNTGGNIVIDFNQAANSPACRNVDRSNAAMLGVFSWSFVDTSGNITEQGDWCVEPLTTLAQNASPNYGGLYYGGSSDSGWGFSVLDVNRGSQGNQVAVDFYYPDSTGKLVWAVANVTPFANGQAIPLLRNAAGYCRTCTPVPQNLVQVGTLTLNFGTQNTMTINATPPSGGTFVRTNIPISNLGVAQ